MRVLLVGEFSGFYYTLKSGLLELGCDVTHASGGFAWGKREKDIPLMPEFSNKKLINLYRYAAPCINKNQMLGYDVVQFINPAILSPINLFNGLTGREIIRSSGKSFLSACGDDAFYFEARKNLRYNPLDDAKRIDYRGRKLSIEYSWYKKWNHEMVSLVNGVIPVMFDYAQAYRLAGINNLRSTIALPVDTKRFSYIGCGQNKKIKVMHGLNRSGYKGTSYVTAAFEILNKKYNGTAEFIIQDKLPFHDYVESLSTIDIIVDQVNTYSSGINGLIGMALGKVVVGGSEPESNSEFNLIDSPVVNVFPEVDNIVKKISALIDAKDRLTEMGRLSRSYVEANHDHIKIAEMYLNEWSV